MFSTIPNVSENYMVTKQAALFSVVAWNLQTMIIFFLIMGLEALIAFL